MPLKNADLIQNHTLWDVNRHQQGVDTGLARIVYTRDGMQFMYRSVVIIPSGRLLPTISGFGGPIYGGWVGA
jgi:hypothetical protein